MTPQTRVDGDVIDVAFFQQLLEHNLQERLDILRELEPHALPTVDPVAYQTAASHRAVIEQITAALNRADAGTYGICARCGGQIPPARLEVVPHAASCASCPVAAHAS